MADTLATALADRAAKRAVRSAASRDAAEIRKKKGNEFFKTGDYEGAALCYIQAIDLHGPKPIYSSNLAATYLKLEFHEEAEDAATLALYQDPTLIKARYRRGLARKKLQRLDAAIIDFQTVLEADPKCLEAKEELSHTRRLLESGEGISGEWDLPDDGLPHLRDTKWEIASMSDSSDCNHVGNGIACRFYNHGRCFKGEYCNYSHAPDEKSVRDKLGKNVCLYYLLGSCKFDIKCNYLHSRRSLPSDGWWNNHKEVMKACVLAMATPESEMVKSMPPGMLQKMRIGSAFGRSLRQRCQGPMLGPGENLDAEWKVLVNTKAGDNGAEKSKLPSVVILSLEHNDCLACNNGHLFSALAEAADVSHVMTSDVALLHLAGSDLHAVLVTDSGVAGPENSHVLSALVEYTKLGGTVVIGGQFSSFVFFTTMDSFFGDGWGLPWRSRSYGSREFSVNPSFFENDTFNSKQALPSSFHIKSLNLGGVRLEDQVYVLQEEDDSDVDSEDAIHLRKVNDPECPVAYTRIGKGYMGYNGDVNGEETLTRVMLAMLRLPT